MDSTRQVAEQIAAELRDGAAIAIVGEAGAGKTFLVDHVVSLLGGVARTGGLRTLTDRPLLPFRWLLRELSAEDVEVVADQVVAHVDRVEAAALVCEDLQWFDTTSVAVMEALRGRVPVLWTERLPATVTERLAPVELVRVAPLAPPDARELLRGLGVADDRLEPCVHAGAGHPARLRELAGGRRSALLAADLAAPLLATSAATRRRAAWLSHTAGAELSDTEPSTSEPSTTEPSSAALEASGRFDGVGELLDLGVAWRTDAGVVLRFDEFGELAEASLGADERRSLHRELAKHWRDDPVRTARHLAAAGLASDAATAAAVALATATPPVGAESTEMWTIAAAGAAPEQRADRWLGAANAAAADAEYELALTHLTSACSVSPAIATTTLWRHAHATALAGVGRVEDALAAVAADGAASASDELGLLIARLLAWPMLQLDDAARIGPADPFVTVVTTLVGPDGSDDPDGLAGRSAAVPPTGGDDTTRLAVIAACVPGRAEAARELIARGGGAGRRLELAERSAAEQVVDLVTLGSCVAAMTELDRWCSDAVLGAHRALLTAHLALAAADTGTTGDAAARLAALAPAHVAPAGHAAIVEWARAEVELAAARPRRAAAAARAAMNASPVGSPLHDVALVAAAWTAELGVEVPLRSTPRLRAAAHEVRGVTCLVAGEWSVARSAFLDAARAWSGVLRRSELRCRWGAAEAGRHGGVASAIDELHEVERLADELGQRSLVARARASLRDAGVRRSPRRGAHPSGLTLREVEVLERVADGLTSGEIGQQLGVARSTVDTLADSARRKLGAKNRRHAALLLSELQR